MGPGVPAVRETICVKKKSQGQFDAVCHRQTMMLISLFPAGEYSENAYFAALRAEFPRRVGVLREIPPLQSG